VVAGPPTRDPIAVVALPPEESERDSAAARLLESFEVPAFRWYFAAQFGTWGAMNMQMVVNGYLVFVLTDSYAALGMTALTRSLPGIVLALVGGVLADRLPKKYLVQVAQFASGLVAVAVGLLLWFDLLRFEHLLISSFLQGALMSLMMPARLSMLPALVGIPRIQNAQALGMGMMNLMRMAGPAAGGAILALTGAYYAYFLMAGLYFWATAMYVKVPNIESLEQARRDGAAHLVAGAARAGAGTGAADRSAAGRPKRASAIHDLLEGVRYVRRERTIGTLLAVNLAIVLVSMPYQMLLPGYVLDVMQSGPGTLGALQSISGVGAVAAIVVIAAMPTHQRGKILLLGSMLMGVALVAFSFSTALILTAPILIVVSIGQTFRMSLSSVLIQTYVRDEFRGRVNSLFMMEMSMVSLSTFIAGLLAARFGAQLTIGSLAVILLVLTTWIWLFVPRLRELD
jgi:MFS family permease